jgi:phosphatidylglycerol:prolipoprotein diacylglycerol transferase
LLAQAIGRWGNFFNSEAHGVATTLEHLKSLHIPNFIINGMKIEGVYYTPTFLYESLACFLLFIVFIFIRRGTYRKVGTMTALYLIGYGMIRFFIEISRTDALMLYGFKVAQIASITMIIIGIVLLIKNSKKGRFEDLYNDRNNVDNIKF